jgi:hypothetical protein
MNKRGKDIYSQLVIKLKIKQQTVIVLCKVFKIWIQLSSSVKKIRLILKKAITMSNSLNLLNLKLITHMKLYLKAREGHIKSKIETHKM